MLSAFIYNQPVKVCAINIRAALIYMCISGLGGGGGGGKGDFKQSHAS